MTWERPAAALGLLAAGLAIAWVVLAEEPDPLALRPGTKQPPLALPVMTTPDIGAFSEYDPNDSNPFLPFFERQADKAMTGPKPPVRRPTPTKPPPVVEQPTPPAWPKLNAGGSDAPRVVGLLGQGDTLELLVKPANAGAPVRMKIGESQNGWTLVAIDQVGLATFRDAAGRVHRFPIGGTGPTSDIGAPALPPVADKPAAKPELPPAATTVRTRTHTITADDTLPSIAKAYGLTVDDIPAILALNPGIAPTTMRPGMVIKLPPAKRPDPKAPPRE